MIGTNDIMMFITIIANYLFIFPYNKKIASWLMFFTGICSMGITYIANEIPFFGLILATMGAIMLVKYYFPERF